MGQISVFVSEDLSCNEDGAVVVVGSWRLKKLLGEGAFGRVYAGEHALLGAPVCIKQEKTQKQKYMEMFKEEALLLTRLRHPSLPTFLDYLEEGGKVGQLLVLSFIEGMPMDKVEPIDDEHICWILDRIFGALSYLHDRHNLVHCDLKPANAILDIEDHQVTLVDLGMATLKPDEITVAKGGTPGYFPPEFPLGYPPIPASDLYSVGKIGIALAGGNVEQGEPPADMQPLLRKFLLCLIRRDPNERPQSAEEQRDELYSLRQQIFGRTTCLEQFKYRSGAVP
jgi:serine/threonine-protein kinase